MSKKKGQKEKSSFGEKIRNLGGRARQKVKGVLTGLGPPRERVPVRIPAGGGRTGFPRRY